MLVSYFVSSWFVLSFHQHEKNLTTKVVHMMYQKIVDYEKLISILEDNALVATPMILIIESNIVHNLGVAVLSKVIENYQNSPHKIVLNCDDILSYIVLAIEYKIPYLLANINNPNILKSITDLGEKHNTIIFDSIEKMFVYFSN